MKKEIRELIEISQYFGKQKEYTLAGGGNTSYKDEKYIWVKASGSSLASIDEEGFAVLDRSKVQIVQEKKYNSDKQIRELEVKDDLIAANIYPEKQKRPSVETSFHEIINYAFVVHMHPTMTNALMCSNNVAKKTIELFGEEALFISYALGYPLFIKVHNAIISYRKKYSRDPKIIFLENHGVFVSADNIQEIKDIYHSITDKIVNAAGGLNEIEDIAIDGNIVESLPVMKVLLKEDGNKILKIRHSTLHEHFYKNKDAFKKISLPFTPDIIVYCKADYMYIEDSESPELILNSFKKQLPEFKKKNGYNPKIILVKDYGLIAVEDTAEAADIALDVYEDLMNISYYSEYFGGPQFLGPDEIAFIDNWEVENYRRKISKGSLSQNNFEQKICIVTGAAQGFGEGIAQSLVAQGANVIIADLNEEKGEQTVDKISSIANKNQVMYCRTDVSDPVSVKHLIIDTVANFGGIDLFISNAGILRAGSLDEMKPESFSLMTKVNYEGFFHCVQQVSSVMKLQNMADPSYFSDIIQINSKSGLKGSNKNFAYAGAKFGGIGLTQSFALELAPHRIKVNAICPGNFFEGPLWADEQNGLFVQYLKAGKVPGAKTIEDVKAFYEEQVPMGRGCRIEDVVKAIKYIVDQEYETGQAIPVTGGQIMLN